MALLQRAVVILGLLWISLASVALAALLVKSWQRRNRTEWGQWYVEECPWCKGNGMYANGDECSLCGGDGAIETRAEVGG